MSIEIAVCAVPAGEYEIGDASLPISRPAHAVKLAAFHIARTTVTNAQFLAFIAADGYQTEAYWGEMGWRWQKNKQERAPAFMLDRQYNQPDQPVVGVCWYEAQAFANWLAHESGLLWRLPTEAEWESATRDAEGEAPRPRSYNTAERGYGAPWPVTQPGNRSWCGAEDLCGNVWEWTSSRWGRNWQTLDYRYPYHAGDGREDPTGSHARVIRGGSWFDSLREAHPANRGRYLPGSRGSNIGFRLVRGA